ncbi:hypothetical protein [Pseudomonas schmalbachii]|uniref:Uncharacterized protein n=1 Tax=Pseudomonas schmalbachii TaxID=2816993 RepID=A0ABS3TRF9_9PSED|nr:hypothetical protein [Pseudomonas schmalbachii]MBO3276249.1 hypothetical protein [Pseudomonas schmalbachii]
MLAGDEDYVMRLAELADVNLIEAIKDDSDKRRTVSKFSQPHSILSATVGNTMTSKNTMANNLTAAYANKKTEKLIALLSCKLSVGARSAIEGVLLERNFTTEQIKAAERAHSIRGFKWWPLWGGIGLGMSLFWINYGWDHGQPVFLVLALFYSVFCVGVLQFNKWCFLITTVLSLNPLMWIINGIYLKRRWSHPRCNCGEV